MPAISSPKNPERTSCPLEAISLARIALVVLLATTAPVRSMIAHELFEGFDKRGKPACPDGISWEYTAELSPVSGWDDLVPGDGYAHLTADRSALKKRPAGSVFWPFQTLSVGPVTSNQRISIRAKNAAIPGLAGLLFTYREKKKIDEIDIEIVTADSQGDAPGHPTRPGHGWTDVRLNTWANANKNSLLPTRTIRIPITDETRAKVSHRDGRFHIYTIEWKPEIVRFYIDGILQSEIDDIIPDYPSTVIFGLRQMPWAGEPDWQGSQTMLVDWIDIEPVSAY